MVSIFKIYIFSVGQRRVWFVLIGWVKIAYMRLILGASADDIDLELGCTRTHHQRANCKHTITVHHPAFK